MLNRSRIINTNFLTGSQRSCHNLAGSVNNVRSRPQSKTHRSLLAADDDFLARFIGIDRAGLVSCACRAFSCSCWSVRCRSFFSRGGAGLCKRQWRSQAADQSNNCFLHSDASLSIRFTPQFGTHSSNGRSFLEVFGTRRFECTS
jgi:hypothetical protein